MSRSQCATQPNSLRQQFIPIVMTEQQELTVLPGPRMAGLFRIIPRTADGEMLGRRACFQLIAYLESWRLTEMTLRRPPCFAPVVLQSEICWKLY